MTPGPFESPMAFRYVTMPARRTPTAASVHASVHIVGKMGSRVGWMDWGWN